MSGKENKMNRVRFAFGGDTVNEAGCTITESCIECGKCQKVCPFNAISEGTPYVINSKLCHECGNCYYACPVSTIDLPNGI